MFKIFADQLMSKNMAIVNNSIVILYSLCENNIQIQEAITALDISTILKEHLCSERCAIPMNSKSLLVILLPTYLYRRFDVGAQAELMPMPSSCSSDGQESVRHDVSQEINITRHR